MHCVNETFSMCYFFNVQPSDFEVYLRPDMSLIFMNKIGLSAELVNILSFFIHLAYGDSKNVNQWLESNPVPHDLNLLPWPLDQGFNIFVPIIVNIFYLNIRRYSVGKIDPRKSI